LKNEKKTRLSWRQWFGLSSSIIHWVYLSYFRFDLLAFRNLDLAVWNKWIGNERVTPLYKLSKTDQEAIFGLSHYDGLEMITVEYWILRS
jgi:hypothetical protein